MISNIMLLSSLQQVILSYSFIYTCPLNDPFIATFDLVVGYSFSENEKISAVISFTNHIQIRTIFKTTILKFSKQPQCQTSCKSLKI